MGLLRQTALACHAIAGRLAPGDQLPLACLGLFALVMTALALAGTSPVVAVPATALWGFTLGGAPTIFQAASANTSGGAVDVAQSMLVTGLAVGSLVGGITLGTLHVGALPWVGLVIFAAAIGLVSLHRQHAFPAAAPGINLDVDMTPARRAG